MNYTEHIWGLLSEQDRMIYQSLRDQLSERKALLEAAILDPYGNVVVTDMITCLIWQTQSPEASRIAFNKVGTTDVSTVFLTHAHQGKCFETMVSDQYESETAIFRYKTVQEAKIGHDNVVEALKANKNSLRHRLKTIMDDLKEQS